jgi:hypothetical protein
MRANSFEGNLAITRFQVDDLNKELGWQVDHR